MLERLRELKKAGNWQELRTLAPNTLPHLSGDDQAKAYLWLSDAFEHTATTAAEYRTALAHARAAVSVAVPGGLMHTWATGRVANLASDLGDFTGAMVAGVSFLEALPAYPSLETMAPWVRFHMGRVLYYRSRNYAGAARWFRRAVADNAGEISERAALFLVWSLAAAGRVSEAGSVLSRPFAHVTTGQVHAARAAVCFAAGDWHGARTYAAAALIEYRSGAWPVHDTVQAAELLLILSKAAQRLGLHQQAARWFKECATTLARWSLAFVACLAPIMRERGGAWFEEAVCSCGPAGHNRCGLRGVVG